MAASSVWGNNLRISIFGESHGPAVGVVIDGLPAGEEIDRDALLLQMSAVRRAATRARRRARKPIEPEILSGMLEGRTTGAPLCVVIRNTNTRSGDYANLMQAPGPATPTMRPMSSTMAATMCRGGHFSGRLTSCLCAAGAICRQILERRGILIGSHVLSVGPERDLPLPTVEIPMSCCAAFRKRTFPPSARAWRKNARCH